MRIGVLSDTHISQRGRTLPGFLWNVFRGVDLILHAGDIGDESVLLDLKTIAPVEAVLGNTDPVELANQLPIKKVLSMGQKKIGLIHGDGPAGTTLHRVKMAFTRDTVDAIVFGHSHQPFNETINNILMFNPGSCTVPRREPHPSCGILHIDQERIRGEIIYF